MKRRTGFAFGLFAAGLRLATAAEITCASAESMDHLMKVWTQDFTAQHPATPARVTLRTKFSAEAFDALLRGEVTVAPFARELFPLERSRFQEKFGRAPLLVPVAMGSRDTKGGTHAIAIFVHEKNPLARLSVPQLREILAAGGRLRTWGQLGLTGDWAARRIAVHGMTVRRETGHPPGIVNFLEQRILDGRGWRDDVRGHVDAAGGPQALELIVRAVAADEGAIGYSGFAYAQPGTKTLALAETETGPAWTGRAEDVARNDYPLARQIYLCVAAAPDRTMPPEVRAWLEFVLSSPAQARIAADPARFFPLPAAALAEARARLP